MDTVRAMGSGYLKRDGVAALVKAGGDQGNVSRAIGNLVKAGKLDDFQTVISLTGQ
jgi:hypothetical protein